MIEGEIFELLEPLVNGRCYKNKFKQEPDIPKWPAIKFQITSRINEATVCGTDDVSTDDVSVTVDFVAKTDGAAIALRDQGIAAMMTHDPPPDRGIGFAQEDIPTETFVEIFEFVFQQSSVAA